MNEKELSNRIKLAVSNLGAKIFNNPCGVGWLGRVDPTKTRENTVTLKGASRLAFGLIPGSADLIGYYPVKIDPTMVGKTFGLFVSLEVKAPGNKPSEKQENWLRAAKEAGCLAGIVYSEEDAYSVFVEALPFMDEVLNGKK